VTGDRRGTWRVDKATGEMVQIKSAEAYEAERAARTADQEQALRRPPHPVVRPS
jgi:hypothetical protein